MILDAAIGGTMMNVDTEQEKRITDALSSTNYHVQHDRTNGQKDGNS